MFSIFKSKEERVTDQYISAIVDFIERYEQVARFLPLGFDSTLKNRLNTLEQKEQTYADQGYKTIDYFTLFENVDGSLTKEDLYRYVAIRRTQSEKPLLYATDYKNRIKEYYAEKNNLQGYPLDG